MKKTKEFEKTYLWMSAGFAVASTLCVSIYDIATGFRGWMLGHVVFFTIVGLLVCLKYFLVKNFKISNKLTFYSSKILDLFIPVVGSIFLSTGDWVYAFTAMALMFTSITKGRNAGLALLGIFLPVYILTGAIHEVLYHDAMFLGLFTSVDKLSNYFYNLLIFFFTVVISGMIHKHNMENEEENKKLLEQLGEKYQQLEIAQDEIKSHYEKLKNTNNILEDTNKKLTSSIAEFYTLQQISHAISSILDIKELLKYVNDIILGVMGVNYSTITLYDEKRQRLKVHTTNIKLREELITLNDNINNPVLLNCLNNSKSVIENFVDPDEYVFTQGREVNSLICVPLNTKTRKYGLVLIEHKYYSAFDEENVRLLETIGQQVGIAMENAELYQKMQELATIDGLTGVYNRIYFQEKLSQEFKAAHEGNYSLSLAIFDIDHFKRFNDTFGHLFGDKVLKSITDVVSRSLRSSDIFARFGGEEFIILFPRTNLKEAVDKVEMLRQKISQTSIKDNLVTASVTVSFGIACFPECAASEKDLLSRADDALYDAKSAGRNCVRVAE